MPNTVRTLWLCLKEMLFRVGFLVFLISAFSILRLLLQLNLYMCVFSRSTFLIKKVIFQVNLCSLLRYSSLKDLKSIFGIVECRIFVYKKYYTKMSGLL